MLQSLGRQLREQLQVIEKDLSAISRAARAAGPVPGSPMALVLERRKEAPTPVMLPISPAPPREQIEGDYTPEGSGYEILLQVNNHYPTLLCRSLSLSRLCAYCPRYLECSSGSRHLVGPRCLMCGAIYTC